MNAFGSIFDGCQNGYETWKGTLKSKKWHQTTEWIYFEWGCANDINRENENNVGQVKIVFNLYQNASDANPTYSHEYWNDTFSACTMVLRNYEIPSAEFTALSGDFYMSIDFIDDRTNEYGAHEFGYLHVNQTHQQVSDAQWYYYTHCVDAERSVAVLRNHYRLNNNLKNGFVYNVGFAESFDTQESFNSNWVKDVYGNDVAERHADKAISTSTYRNGSNMPFNNTNGFFKGWYGGANLDTEGNERGYVESDDSVYRFVSKPFIMPSNGLVSIKMAGNSASLHLVDFESASDLAWVDVKTFKASGDENPIASTGKNVCTMVNHIINFSKYAGRKVQLAIADVDNKDGGWNAVYFDELKANYETLPAFGIDVVAQTNGGTTYSVFADVYVTSVEAEGGVDYANNDGPDTDTCPLAGAYSVWKDYLEVVRAGREGRNYCTGAGTAIVTDDVRDLLLAYNDLSEEAKQIVCESDDFERVGSGNWYEINPTIYGADHQYCIGSSIKYLAQQNSISVVIYSNGLAISYMQASDATTKVIVTSIVVVASLLVLFFALRKKKENN